MSALWDRPNLPQNIIKSHLNGLETARGDVPKSRPIKARQYTCSSLFFTKGSAPAKDRSMQLALQTISREARIISSERYIYVVLLVYIYY